MDSVYKRLAGQTDIQVSRKDQIISISVEDRDPHRAADMANAYVDALDLINRTVNITEGHRKRVFLENRLKKVQHDLSEAETDLKEFQEKYKLVAIEGQARVSIEGAARIKGEIIAAETELEVLKQCGTERQNEAIMLKSKIAELRNQLAKIERGKLGNEILKPNKISDKNPGFYLPFNELPALGMQLARLMREAGGSYIRDVRWSAKFMASTAAVIVVALIGAWFMIGFDSVGQRHTAYPNVGTMPRSHVASSSQRVDPGGSSNAGSPRMQLVSGASRGTETRQGPTGLLPFEDAAPTREDSLIKENENLKAYIRMLERDNLILKQYLYRTRSKR